ncbi:TonB family protein [Paraburkholderia sp. MMS20-SJTR3]|uniref:TonB family protein n=1 Tax=Paraburkholderia sejongensis TaxID=2886946 RepID=A0ABS8JSX1_9BURK|nr:energy transducer TonB [Paraburkholderia sp. MMS20-SJTR3]MCC8393014.1 TonB family protein [Paraburkholderia sp. MMS20-SJTR3]
MPCIVNRACFQGCSERWLHATRSALAFVLALGLWVGVLAILSSRSMVHVSDARRPAAALDMRVVLMNAPAATGAAPAAEKTPAPVKPVVQTPMPPATSRSKPVSTRDDVARHDAQRETQHATQREAREQRIKPAVTAEPPPHARQEAAEAPPAAGPPISTARSASTDAPPSAAASSASSASTTSTASATATGATTTARTIAQPLPTLPDDLREQAYRTVATARFTIHVDGSVDVELLKATPNPRLNGLLLESLRRWRFFPALRDGHAVESTQDIRVHFNVS